MKSQKHFSLCLTLLLLCLCACVPKAPDWSDKYRDPRLVGRWERVLDRHYLGETLTVERPWHSIVEGWDTYEFYSDGRMYSSNGRFPNGQYYVEGDRIHGYFRGNWKIHYDTSELIYEIKNDSLIIKDIETINDMTYATHYYHARRPLKQRAGL